MKNGEKAEGKNPGKHKGHKEAQRTQSFFNILFVVFVSA